MPLQMLIVSDSELTRPPWTRCCPAERHCRGRGSCQTAPAEGCCDSTLTQSPWSRHQDTDNIDSVIYDINISECSAPSKSHAQCHAMLSVFWRLPQELSIQLTISTPPWSRSCWTIWATPRARPRRGGQGHLQHLCDQHLWTETRMRTGNAIRYFCDTAQTQSLWSRQQDTDNLISDLSDIQ